MVSSDTTPSAAHTTGDTGAAQRASRQNARRRIAHGALLVALLVSAAAALFVQPAVIKAVRAEHMDAMWLAVAPSIFSVVVVLTAVDTWRTARKRGYFRGPSVVLLAACVAFVGLLVPTTFTEYRARTSPPTDSEAWHQQLVNSRDPRVRVLVMEIAGLNADLPNAPDLLAQGLADPDPLVVKAAVVAVERRAGEKLGGPDPRAQARTLVEGWRHAH